MYSSTRELPATIRDVLPEAAQEIYLKAYNEALQMQPANDSQMLSPESMAHQMAWNVVTKEFVHDERTARWYRKGEIPVEEEVEHKGLLQRLKALF